VENGGPLTAKIDPNLTATKFTLTPKPDIETLKKTPKALIEPN